MDPILNEEKQETTVVLEETPNNNEVIANQEEQVIDAQETPVVEKAKEAPVQTEESGESSTSEDATPDNEENILEDEKLPEETSVLTAIENLSGKIEQLSKQFDAKIMHTTHEEKIVDQMHAELQRYKEDMYAQLVRPILLDIIEIRDSIMRMSQSYANKPAEEQAVPLKTFSDYALDVQDILEKNNINIYKSVEGDTFTPIKQRVVKKVSTPVEELHGKVAESMSDGYEYMGKTISPEKIAVYTYEKSEKEGEQE